MKKLIAIAAFVAVSAEAQSWAPSTTTSVFTRQYWGAASSYLVWRGLDAGRWALHAGAAQSWGDPSAGSTNIIISGEASRAFDDRSDASDLVGGGIAVVRRLSNDDTYVWIAADGIAFPGADESETTVQAAAGAQLLVPYWFPERRPLFLVEARRDFQRWETTFVRTALRFDYKLPRPGYGLMAELGHAWSGIPPALAAGSRDFSSQGTDLTVTLLRPDGSRSWEPYVSAIRSGRNSDRFLVHAGIRIVITR